MMAAAEAMHPQGTILGAIFTFLLYGALAAVDRHVSDGHTDAAPGASPSEQAERTHAQEFDADQMETRNTAGKLEQVPLADLLCTRNRKTRPSTHF